MAHNLSDDENPIPSERSSVPSINAQDRDEFLMPESAKKELKPNNHKLNLNMRLQHQVVMEIIKGHPLAHAFTVEHRVPLFYLQQVWYTLEYHPDEDDHHFTLQVDDFVARLTISRLRRILQLPRHDDFPGLADYEELPPEDEMLDAIRALGYDESTEPLTSVGQFKRMFLPQIYFTFFSLINRCLTGKHTGMDRASTAVLRIFLGVVYNRHFDYAALIWTDLRDYVTDRHNNRDREFLPYQRFLQLIIHRIMQNQPDIPRRHGAPKGPSYVQKYLKLNNKVFPNVMIIPEALLSMANQDAPSVIDYRERHGLVAPQQPDEPAQEPNPGNINEMGEGPLDLDEQVQDIGVPEQGVEGNVRGEDEGGASDEPQPNPQPDPPTPDHDNAASSAQPSSSGPRRRRLKSTVSREHIRQLPSLTPSSSETESDEPLLKRPRRASPIQPSEPTQSAPELSEPLQTEPVAATTEPVDETTPPVVATSTPIDQSETEPPTSTPLNPPTESVQIPIDGVISEDSDSYDDFLGMGDLPEPSPTDSHFGPFDFEHSLDDVPIPDLFNLHCGEIRRTEGVQVEKEKVSERRESEKVIVSAESTTPTQVTATASTSHSLGSTSGQDAVDLAAQLHTPPATPVSHNRCRFQI